ncbi:MAG TPA: TRAM domain-containing protein [Chthoniobacterales bacterium]
MKPSRAKSDHLPNLRIDDVAFGGDGVARHESKVIFVPFTIPGERVDVEVIERRSRFERAVPRHLVQPSPRRTEPACPYFGPCGGCAYQHMEYGLQLETKRAQVEQTLRRIAHLQQVRVSPVIASPHPFGYRNRITVHSDGARIGYFRARSRSVLDIEQCPLASAAVNAKLAQLRRQGLPAGAHQTLREPSAAVSFQQVNDEVAGLLREYVATVLQGGTLIDAYCGAGFFAHRYASGLERVLGLEWSGPAVEAARRAAYPNETYELGDVAVLLGPALQGLRPGTLLFDPPAEGLAEAVVAATLASPPPCVVYVSCNPATLARDLGRLCTRYQVTSVQPFDMFAQTAEIEMVATLQFVADAGS